MNMTIVQTTNIKEYIELIEAFHIGLSNGLLDKQEVVKWADKIIEQDDEPDINVIELSLCGHQSVNDIVSLLNEIVGYPRPPISGRVILGLLYNNYKNGKVTLEKVAGSMNWIIWQSELTDDEKSFMHGIDDMYDLAVSGTFGTVEDFEMDTLRFIEIYKDFRIDNFEEWKAIDSIIDEKVKHLSVIVDADNKERMEKYSKKNRKPWWKFWKN